MQGLVINFEKQRRLRFLGHLDLHRALLRTLARAELPVAFSHGFNPQPHVIIARPLPVYAYGKAERLFVELESFLAPKTALQRLQQAQPPGVRFSAAQFYAGKHSPFADLERERYRLDFEYPAELEIRADTLEQQLLAALEAGFAVVRQHKGKQVKLVLKEHLLGLAVKSCRGGACRVEYTTRLNLQRALRPSEACRLVQAVLPGAVYLEGERLELS